jgi:hypothetical protein
MIEEVNLYHLGEHMDIDRLQLEKWKREIENDKIQAGKSKSNISETKSEDRPKPEPNWNQFHEEHFLRLAEEFEALMQKMRLKNPQEYFIKFIR